MHPGSLNQFQYKNGYFRQDGMTMVPREMRFHRLSFPVDCIQMHGKKLGGGEERNEEAEQTERSNNAHFQTPTAKRQASDVDRLSG